MIQLIVNTNLLREIDEHKIVTTYARHFSGNVFDRNIIKENLKIILDWDSLGNDGLGLFCGKFEDIKRNDWESLIDLIINNNSEIEKISSKYEKIRIKDYSKKVLSSIEEKETKKKERFTNENYTVSGRGKKAKPCMYEGRQYLSRKECQYKENLSHSELYKYLAKTGQLEPTSIWVKLYGKK